MAIEEVDMPAGIPAKGEVVDDVQPGAALPSAFDGDPVDPVAEDPDPTDATEPFESLSGEPEGSAPTDDEVPPGDQEDDAAEETGEGSETVASQAPGPAETPPAWAADLPWAAMAEDDRNRAELMHRRLEEQHRLPPEKQRILELFDERRARQAAPEAPAAPRIDAAVFKVPDDYADDPAIGSLVGQFNKAMHGQTEALNYTIEQNAQLAVRVQQIGQENEAAGMNQAWRDWQTANPAYGKLKGPELEAVHAGMNQEFWVYGEHVPVQSRWDRAFASVTRDLDVAAARTQGARSESKQMQSQGRRAAATRAASARRPAIVGTTSPDPDAYYGKSFVECYEQPSGK